jgi:uncharacterized protein (TIGR04222 family)
MTQLATAPQSSAFLIAYGGAMIAAFILSLMIGQRMRATGRRLSVEDLAMLAWLAGGATRYTDAIVTGLLARGALAVAGRGKLEVVDRSKAETATERRIVALSSPFTFATVCRHATDDAEPMLRRMVDQGLIADQQHLHRKRIAQVAPLVALLGAGALLWMIARSTGQSIFVFTFLLGMTALMIVMRWTWLERRTQGGIDALDAAHEKHERLGRGAPLDELPLAVALFGTGVLAGSALDAYHKLRAASDSSGGGEGGSNSSDGGCGGGCGGD